jgi:hypothetical protein
MSLALLVLQDQAHGYMSGKWNSYVDLEPCHPDGSVIEGAEKRRLWTCADKPEGDMYGCTQFALQVWANTLAC